MSEKKGERQPQQSQISQQHQQQASQLLQVSAKESKEEGIVTAEKSQGINLHRQQQPPIISSQFISSPISNLSPAAEPQQQQQHLDTVNVKRPRFSPNPTGHWKLVIPQLPSSDNLISSPPAQLASHNFAVIPGASSSDTASSPSHSPILSLPTSSDTATTKLAEPNQAHNLQFRKGKYVSPVWKPHEMLWLARAWRIQYQGGSGAADADHGPTTAGSAAPAGGGRGKTRAEKDREVAEFLKSHGVNRDAKTAGTKWDNMLGEFRKVYEWERGGEREQLGKSYFRLSPYERKIHRLPASFDEEVFEELAQFMGSRIRSSSSSSTLMSPSHCGRGLIRSTPLSFLGSFGDEHIRATPLVKPLPPAAAPLPPLREDDTSFPVRSRHLIMASGMDPPYLQGGRASLLGFDQSPPLEIMAPSSRELRRVGRIKLTWEESVSLWTDEESEHHKGRVKLEGSSFLNADELTYFDDSMVACTFESYTDGPLKGFSVDKFVAGQQLKVLGRRKPALAATAPSGSIERLHLPLSETPTRPTPSWEMSDPTDYYMGCLRVPPLSLPSLYELSWHIQEPPAEDLRFPLRKDLYRDLPQGKELFTTTSNESSLDSRSFTIDLLSPLIRTTPVLTSPTSRESFISLWDDCINRLVSRFCPIQMNLLRKPASNNWPNVTGFVKNFCLWRGEETDRSREGADSFDPSASIVEKLFWSFGDLPYVLGYYGVGHVVTFCALSKSPDENKIVRTDIYSLDLSIPSERIKALVPCWRIACLLPLLAERSPKFSDFARLEHGSGHFASEMTPRTVTRFYGGKEKWSAVKEVYDVLSRQVPYTEHVMGWSEADMSITFSPRGYKAKPATAEELAEALKHVSKALVALHDLSFMHRDLSWEKVLRRCDKEAEWVLCGFEEMATAPQINNPFGPGSGSGSGSRAPEMGRSSGVHGVKVDVWGIGYLVRTSGIGGGMLPRQLKELERRCLDQNPEQRPTAADCYHHLLQFQAAVAAAVGDSYGG